jgi:excisionase family DNA binding protein
VVTVRVPPGVLLTYDDAVELVPRLRRAARECHDVPLGRLADALAQLVVEQTATWPSIVADSSTSDGEWLTVADVARRLGKSERTVRRRCKEGTLPARMVDGRYRIKETT